MRYFVTAIVLIILVTFVSKFSFPIRKASPRNVDGAVGSPGNGTIYVQSLNNPDTSNKLKRANWSCRNTGRPVDIKLFPYLRSILSKRDFEGRSPFRFSRQYRMVDGKPVILPVENYGAILCLHHKVGSTAWRRILSQTYDICPRSCPGDMRKGVKNPSLLVSAERAKQLANLSVEFTPRMTFVRNPYDRLLSAYLDKYFKNKKNEIRVPLRGTRKQVPFNRLVTYMYGQYKKKGTRYMRSLDGHFSPLVYHCGINEGYDYDFYLKVEEQGQWFQEVADLLLLSNSSRKEASKSGWYQRSADSLDNQYYSYQLREMVYEMYKEDFDFFRYSH